MALDRLRDQIRAISQGWAGSIRVGAFGTASQHLLPAAVRSFVGRYPGSEVMLEEGLPTEMLRSLAARDLDVALVYSHGPSQRKWSQELTFIELLTERMVLLLPENHRFADSLHVSLADLRDEKWIASHEGTPGADGLEELCAAAGMTPNIGFRTNDPDVIERLVSERVEWRSYLHSASSLCLASGPSPWRTPTRCASSTPPIPPRMPVLLSKPSSGPSARCRRPWGTTKVSSVVLSHRELTL